MFYRKKELFILLMSLIAMGICLVITGLLFAPSFRQIGMLRPIALFFLFEGIWIFVDYIVTKTAPGSDATQWIHYIGIIVFGGYMLVCLFYSRPKKARKEKTSAKKKRKPQSKHINIEDRPQ